MGMPSVHGTPFQPPPSTPQTHSFIPRWLGRISQSSDKEAPTSIYYDILSQEHHTTSMYHLYDTFVYGALILQLVISAALIIFGAIPKSFHIAIAILGAANGVITGILSIIKGQGLPVRLIKYAASLRKVRASIEWNERQLRAGLSTVTLRDVSKIRNEYESVRADELSNHPDVWQSSAAVGIKNAGDENLPSKQQGTNLVKRKKSLLPL